MGITWKEVDESGIEQTVLSIYDLLYEMRHEEVKSLLEDSLKDCNETEFSRRYFWNILIKYLDSIYFKINEYSENSVKEMSGDLIANIDSFPETVKLIVYDLNYYHHRKCSDDDGSSLYPIDINLVTTPGKMFLYHRYQKMVGNGSIAEALNLYSKIEEILNKDRNFKRLIESDILKSILFTRIGEFKEAEHILLNARNLAKIISYTRPAKRILENLIWNALRENDFEKAIEYMMNEIECFSDTLSDSNIIFFPYCLLSGGDQKNALIAISWIREKLVLDSLDKKILSMTEDLIKNRRKMFVRNSNLCLKEAENINATEIMKFILNIQVRFYENIQDWENAYIKLLEMSRL